MALIPDRVRGLIKVKNRRHEDVPGIDANLLSKWLGGHKKMDPGDLRRLAEALDASSDYLIGLGDDYRAGGKDDNYAFAAAKMSFGYFVRDADEKVTADQKQRCSRIWTDDALLLREGAPMTAEAWKSLAAMIDRAVPIPPRIGAARTG